KRALLLRLPTLLPLSFAAGALLVVARETWLTPAAPRVLTRAVAIRQSLPLTAATALVRAAPQNEAAVGGELSPGDLVDISGEDGEWYRVDLSGGSQGWVERHAFE